IVDFLHSDPFQEFAPVIKKIYFLKKETLAFAKRCNKACVLTLLFYEKRTHPNDSLERQCCCEFQV
ncbi:hypothetical protein D0809_27620, partial [Flavobacterium circumlabens]